MILTELTTVPAATLPLTELKQHLRLGTGFAPGDEQDELLEAYLRAAISSIEGRTGVVLIERDFLWELSGWRQYDRQVLPVRPVSAVFEVRIVDRDGAPEVVDANRYHLSKDALAPSLVAIGLTLPLIPSHAVVEVRFTAGFGPAWSDVPPDLARAVLLLAAEFYEHRSGSSDLPKSVSALVERFRNLRLGLV